VATAADNAAYTQCLFGLAQEVAPAANALAGPRYWDGLEFDFSGDSGVAFLRQAAAFRPRGLRILISDLLWPAGPAGVLARLGYLASSVVVVQLLAREDAQGPPSGHLRLVDSESGLIQEVNLDGAARARYRAALSRHQQIWHGACRAAGAVLVSLVAEDLLEGWNLEPLLRRDVLKVS
jgi:hypothetical protein